MLVLSRKKDQQVCFPALGITVKILRVSGSTVRVGVDAPMEVQIIRDELENGPVKPAPRQHVIRLPQNLRHELRNQLNSLSIALHLFKQEIDAGYRRDAEATFERLVEHLERITRNEALASQTIKTKRTSPDAVALLVEDEPNEREMLAGFLRLHGYQITTAADGLEAIDYLESNLKPSVVLIDMRMPRCDGPTTIRRIRENPAFDAVKIFAISGSTAQENQINVEAEGVNRWFLKPLNPQLLVDALAISAGDPEPTAA